MVFYIEMTIVIDVPTASFNVYSLKCYSLNTEMRYYPCNICITV